jgi:hypothetical protein
MVLTPFLAAPATFGIQGSLNCVAFTATDMGIAAHFGSLPPMFGALSGWIVLLIAVKQILHVYLGYYLPRALYFSYSLLMKLDPLKP